ncbi:MAG: hypothetical protein EZS28_046500 [Streblomastix strix]|uniref:Reverse transcriptase domain-containing protein n=1 Tax=Streblomastix strix TaxID=222440 RepID=A0A5J4TJL7_9EUKA|nr:MAG: hypothetical protein EZS28_046500 [Streblomastix strix]
MLITRGIKAYWISKQAPSILDLNKTIPNQRKSHESEQALGLPIQKELQEKIVEEISFNQLKWINPCFAIPKKEQGKWRNITDCSLLNQYFLSTHFIMEDIQSLRLLLQPKDWMIKIDLESAFHHIQVDTEFRPFLGFTFNYKFYQSQAMCFGVKHAPLIFHKTLRPVIKFIREVLQTNEDETDVRQMEKDRSQPTDSESQILGEFHRVLELPEAPILARRDPYEETEQDQLQSCAIEGME